MVLCTPENHQDSLEANFFLIRALDYKSRLKMLPSARFQTIKEHFRCGCEIPE